MRNLIKNLGRFFLAAGIIIYFSGCGEDKGEVEVTVGGDPIYEKEVLDRWEEIKINHFSNENITEEQLDQLSEQYYPMIVESIINQKIEKIAASRREIIVNSEEIEQRYSEIIQFTPDFEQFLKQEDITEKEIKNEIENQIISQKIYESVTSEIESADEQEIRQYYENNIDRFIEGGEIRASHILKQIEPEDGPEQRDAKQRELKEILEKARAGEDFSSLAKEYSEGPSGPDGGNLGYFSRGQMVPQFEAAAFSLEKGQISDIVETQFGYHIIKLMDKKEAVQQNFLTVKDEVEQMLLEQKKEEKHMGWLDQKKAELVEYPE